MKAVILDTNIISFIFKKDSRAISYTHFLKDQVLTVSFMTVAELYQWAIIRNWGENRKQKMEAELKKYIIFPYDIITCKLWGEIRANRIQIGQPISTQDAWIAATAKQHNLTLITHNPDDFQNIKDLDILSII